MPSSRGAKKAAQRRPTLKPASLISKRSSNGLLHPRRGGREVSSRHRTNRNQVGAPAPRRRGLSPRRRGRAHLSGSGRPSPPQLPLLDPQVARELGILRSCATRCAEALREPPLRVGPPPGGTIDCSAALPAQPTHTTMGFGSSTELENGPAWTRSRLHIKGFSAPGCANRGASSERVRSRL